MKHKLISLWLLLVSGLIITSSTASYAQPCPPFAIGEVVVMRSGDVFEGRPVEVFQPGFFQDGTPGYVVRLLTNDPPPARGGYISATGCELSRELP